MACAMVELLRHLLADVYVLWTRIAHEICQSCLQTCESACFTQVWRAVSIDLVFALRSRHGTHCVGGIVFSGSTLVSRTLVSHLRPQPSLWTARAMPVMVRAAATPVLGGAAVRPGPGRVRVPRRVMPERRARVPRREGPEGRASVWEANRVSGTRWCTPTRASPAT